MSLKHLKFDLTDEQLKKRHQEAKELSKVKEVKEFLNETKCPFDLYEENITKFKRWVKAKREAESYTKEEIKNDLRKGEYLDLEYNEDLNTLFEVVRRLPVVKEIEDETRFLERYKIFPLPKSLHEAFYNEINLDKESENPSYLQLIRNLIKFNDNNELGYYLYGNLGVGKSFLAACASNRKAKEGKNVAFVHVPSLLNHLKQQFGNKKEEERTLEDLRKVSLLVLDDLGSEPITPWSRDEILLSILNDRLENQRKTIITSNYKPSMLSDLYQIDTRGISDELRAKRLVDRIRALTKAVEVTGKNRRHG